MSITFRFVTSYDVMKEYKHHDRSKDIKEIKNENRVIFPDILHSWLAVSNV